MCVSCNVITYKGCKLLLLSTKKIFEILSLASNLAQFKLSILRAPLLLEMHSL